MLRMLLSVQFWLHRFLKHLFSVFAGFRRIRLRQGNPNYRHNYCCSHKKRQRFNLFFNTSILAASSYTSLLQSNHGLSVSPIFIILNALTILTPFHILNLFFVFSYSYTFFSRAVFCLQKTLFSY